MSQSTHADKISPGPLRDFLAGAEGVGARETVIVEAASGPLVEELPRSDFSGISMGKVKLRASDRGEHDAVAELGALLRELTARKPKWLKFADAYVVEDVTAEQLRQIASWPQTGMVRPNRMHRARA